MESTNDRARRRTQAERRSHTRAGVLAAARDVFARRGLHGASLEEIAEQAGVSRGAVYYNFADKETLFAELLRERCRDYARALEQSLKPGGDAERGLRRTAVDFLEDADRERDWTRLFFEFSAVASQRPDLRSQLADELAGVQAVMAQALAHQLPPPDDLAMPIEHVAIGLSALANGIALERLVDPTLPADLLAQLIEVVINGLTKRPT